MNFALLPKDTVAIKDGKVVTTSLRVAEIFGKRHDNVLRDIRALDCSPEFTALNFEASAYIDSTRRNLSMFEMTKDGLVFLIMGYTGAKAAQFKEAYIVAFNAMEAELTRCGNVTAPVLPDGSGFIPVDVEGKHHYVRSVDWQGSSVLMVALRPVADEFGLAWTAVFRAVLATEGLTLSCMSIPRRWGLVMLSNPLGDVQEPNNPNGPRMITCVPVHQLPPLMLSFTNDMAAGRLATLATATLTGWHRYAVGGRLAADMSSALIAGTVGNAGATQISAPYAGAGIPVAPSRNTPITELVMEKMRTLRRQGISIQEIARHLARSHITVRWVLRGMEAIDTELRRSWGPPLRGLDDTVLHGLYQQRADGESLSALSRECRLPADLLSLAFRGMAFAAGGYHA